MNFGQTYISKLKLVLGVVTLLFLLAGLVGGLYLVQKQQELRSKAAWNPIEAITVADQQGQELQIIDPQTQTYQSNSSYIQIKIDDVNNLVP